MPCRQSSLFLCSAFNSTGGSGSKGRKWGTNILHITEQGQYITRLELVKCKAAAGSKSPMCERTIMMSQHARISPAGTKTAIKTRALSEEALISQSIGIIWSAIISWSNLSALASNVHYCHCSSAITLLKDVLDWRNVTQQAVKHFLPPSSVAPSPSAKSWKSRQPACLWHGGLCWCDWSSLYRLRRSSPCHSCYCKTCRYCTIIARDTDAQCLAVQQGHGKFLLRIPYQCMKMLGSDWRAIWFLSNDLYKPWQQRFSSLSPFNSLNHTQCSVPVFQARGLHNWIQGNQYNLLDLHGIKGLQDWEAILIDPLQGVMEPFAPLETWAADFPLFEVLAETLACSQALFPPSQAKASGTGSCKDQFCHDEFLCGFSSLCLHLICGDSLVKMSQPTTKLSANVLASGRTTGHLSR